VPGLKYNNELAGAGSKHFTYKAKLSSFYSQSKAVTLNRFQYRQIKTLYLRNFLNMGRTD
jgi:hypothetical protein